MQRNQGPKATDLVRFVDWPADGDPVTVRFIGPVVARMLYKVKVMKRDGTPTEITKVSLAFDPATESMNPKIKCPYAALPKSIASGRVVYFGNAIVRPLQEDKPRKDKPMTKAEAKTGLKDIGSDAWTPVRVVRIVPSLMERLQALVKRNKVKIKGETKTFTPEHPKYGFDLDLSFNKKSKTPANMYGADAADSPSGDRQSPLSEEEKEYLVWDLEKLFEPEDLETARAEAKSLKERWLKEHPEDGDDDDTPPRGKGSSKKRRDEDDESGDDDGEGDDDGDEEMDLDDDDKPGKNSKKRRDEGDDESGDVDDDESDGDTDSDDDGDDDSGDDDGDDDDSGDDDSGDDDSGDDDDSDSDEDDDKSSKNKRGGSSKKSSKTSSKKRRDDDGDDDGDDDSGDGDEGDDDDGDGDDDDLDLGEDDDPDPKEKKKSSSKKSGAKSGTKKSGKARR